MGPAEVAYRSWQEASRSFARIAHDAKRREPCLNGHLAKDPVLNSVGARLKTDYHEDAARYLFRQFFERGRQSFFRGATDNRLPGHICGRYPRTAEAASIQADDASFNRFEIPGHDRLFFGEPVNWHRDPLSGLQAPQIRSDRIDFLDQKICGDHKVIWELNRHQWMLGLGQAYLYRRDEKYAEQFVFLLRQWMRANPPGLGINWASSLEVSLRLMSWCWAMFMFRNAKAFTPSLFVDMLAWIRAHAVHVERNLSYYFSPNTHLTGEALGLFYAGVLCQELGEAARWRKTGQRILEDQIRRQVSLDGVYFEQSTRYQHYSVEIYLHYLLLARRNRLPVAPVVEERVKQMLDFLLAVRRPDGSVPQIGDNDGGSLLPFERRGVEDYRATFSTAAVVFGSPEYAWAAGELATDSLWLAGSEAQRKFQTLGEGRAPITRPSRLFGKGGYAVIRNHWDEDGHQLIFDAGPLGCPYSSGHGHADLLAIQCSAHGRPFLVDPGTYCYNAERAWRDHFRGTAAHNTVTVDGLDQVEPGTAFSWHGRAAATLRRWHSARNFILVDAEHDAYHRLDDPVTHRRRVYFNGRYWIVVDDLSGREQHRLELNFQFAPGIALSETGNDWITASYKRNGGQRLLLQTFATAPCTSRVAEGESAPPRGWYSPDYGARVPAPQLIRETQAKLPVRLVTLLLPMEDATVPPAVRQIQKGGDMHLEFETGGESIRIMDHEILTGK